MNRKEITMVVGAAVTAAIILGGVFAMGMVVINDTSNNPLTTAVEHTQDNRHELQELLAGAASKRRNSLEIPPQEVTAECSAPPHHRQARDAIGVSQVDCRLSLYGEYSQVEADYLVFMDHRSYSLWEILWNRMEYPIRDAYLDAGSLEINSPHLGLRIEPEENGEQHAGETPAALRLAETTGKMSEQD